MTVRSSLGAVALAAVVIGAAPAAAETLYVEAGRILPVEGDPIDDGRIVIEDGKITAVGKDVERPAFSRRIDARHQTVTPGFVVPYTRLGLPQGGGGGGRSPVGMQPTVKGSAELYARHPSHELALRHGVTTLGLLPMGSKPGIRGQISAVSTGPGLAKDKTLKAGAALLIRAATHPTWRDAVSGAFTKAEKKIEDYEEKKKQAERNKAKGGSKPKPPKDPLSLTLRGKLPVVLEAGTPAGWIAARDALPLDDDDWKVTLVDAADLYTLAEEFAEQGVDRVVTRPFLVSVRRTRFPLNRAAEYEAAGIPFAFMLPFENESDLRILRDAAVEMARTGCSEKATLAALTRESAEVLGLGKQVGSVAKGRRADLLFWSGSPFDPTARLEQVMVAGELHEPLPLATGDES